MKVDGGPGVRTALVEVAGSAAAAEAAGYDGVFVPETIHDPFVVLTLAAQATTTVELGTKVAIAFARSPMALAYTANDIHELSKGRLVLGLGTQVRAHILRRFSMPWDRPAARMREYALALRAIWDSWNNDTDLNFQGEFFTHTLMNPLFRPEANRFGRPEIMLAGVGPRMIEVAGEVADRFAAHSFTSPDYLAEVVRPALARGALAADRDPDDIEIAVTAYIATGNNDEEIEAAAEAMRRQIAFYGSTPSYTPILAHHGLEGLHKPLLAGSRRGEWAEMARSIDDDALETFTVVGPPESIAPELIRRWGNLADRVSFYYLGPGKVDWSPIVAELQAG